MRRSLLKEKRKRDEGNSDLSPTLLTKEPPETLLSDVNQTLNGNRRLSLSDRRRMKTKSMKKMDLLAISRN